MATRSRGRPSNNPPKGRVVGRHLKIGKYAPFEPFQTVELLENSYKARSLLNSTVMAFHTRGDDNLSERQIAARDAFVTKFTERKKAYGGKLKANASTMLFEVDIQWFFNWLDEFFFFNNLARRTTVESGIDIVRKDPMGIEDRIEGQTYITMVRRYTFVKININIGSKGRLYELEAIVGQLMHEMVHAYFLIFACNCQQCSIDALNTVGVKDDAHGPLFLLLHRLILTEIRRWGGNESGLEALLGKDCPGASVSKNARARAMKAIGNMDPREMAKLNNPRLRSPLNLLVYYSIDGGVFVQPSLIMNQLYLEDAIRTRLDTWEEYLYDAKNLPSKDEDEDDDSNRYEDENDSTEGSEYQPPSSSSSSGSHFSDYTDTDELSGTDLHSDQ